MPISAQALGFFAAFRRPRALLSIVAAAVVGALAVPGSGEARAARPGGYDGIWNVLIITQGRPLRRCLQLSVPGRRRSYLAGRRGYGIRDRSPRRWDHSQDFSGWIGCYRKRPTRRQLRRRRLERQASGGNCSGYWQASRS